MSLELLFWVCGGLYFLGNEPSLGQKSPMLHLPQYSVGKELMHILSGCQGCTVE